MISTAELVPVSKDKKNNIDHGIISLWPIKKKGIKINPVFEINKYFFRVRTKVGYSEPIIVINGFETIELINIDPNNTESFEYKSKDLTAKAFLGFNLGLLELELKLDHLTYTLTTLNNKQSLITTKELNYMYESVAESELFNFYKSMYSRANSLAQETEVNDSSRQFWLNIAIAKELLTEIDLFLSHDLAFTNRVHTLSVVKKYNSHSVVEDSDIQWLMANPNELIPLSEGPLSFSGLTYSIDNMSQSVTGSDYDTYENRLLISCLYSIKSTLISICDEHEEITIFPHRSVQQIISKTEKIIANLNSTLKLSPPFNTVPEYTNKYLDDIRYKKLFGLISRWYNNNNLERGNSIRSPIYGITTIFEHYCVIKIIECLRNNGFEIDQLNQEEIDTTSSIVLSRGNEKLTVYYEPTITNESSSPLKTSKSEYRPDIVLNYSSGNVRKCGIIDAKFSPKKMVITNLSKDIFYKYGLFLHRRDNSPIDYVYAMYPSTDQFFDFNEARNSTLAEMITPKLGSFSIPFHKGASNLTTDFLIKLIAQ